MKLPRPTRAVLALALTVLPTLAAPAAVIGHWLFEDNTNLGLDSSGSGRTLTVSGTSAAALTPSPTGGGVNTLGVNLNGSSNVMSLADETALAFSTGFTFEAYLKHDQWAEGGTPRVIAAQTNTATAPNGRFGWQLGVASVDSSTFTTNGTLFMQMTSTGQTANAVNFNSGFALAEETLYYVAVSVSIGGTGVGTTVNFYLKNLTTNVLQTSSITQVGLTSLYDSDAPFMIGASQNAGSATRNFDGQIDEARLSNTTLGSSDLLINIPEPEGPALILGVVGLWACFSRRHRVSQLRRAI
jgi:hypothetical protein